MCFCSCDEMPLDGTVGKERHRNKCCSEPSQNRCSFDLDELINSCNIDHEIKGNSQSLPHPAPCSRLHSCETGPRNNSNSTVREHTRPALICDPAFFQPDTLPEIPCFTICGMRFIVLMPRHATIFIETGRRPTLTPKCLCVQLRVAGSLRLVSCNSENPY